MEDRSVEVTSGHDVASLLHGDDLIDIARRAEQRVEAVKKIKELSMRVTNAGDWIDENRRPYLRVSGAEKVARLFGVGWRIDEPSIEEHPDGHVSYTYKGYFLMSGKEIEVIGTRSSRDPFFSRARGGDVDPATINRGNVKKAAYTNCVGNGVTRILGIRNLTWEELAAAGIRREGSASVDRNSGPCAPKFGEYAGKPLPEVPDAWLSRYADLLAKSIEDPAKVKFKALNQKMFDAILEEVDRRKAEAVLLDDKKEEEVSS